jgi:hypothetical protein
VHTDGLTDLLGVLDGKLIDAAMKAKPNPKDMEALFGYDLWRHGSEFSQKHSGRKFSTVPQPKQSWSNEKNLKRKQQQGDLPAPRALTAKVKVQTWISIEKRVRNVLERFWWGGIMSPI